MVGGVARGGSTKVDLLHNKVDNKPYRFPNIGRVSMSYVRKSSFRADVEKAYHMVSDSGILDDAVLQYRLNCGHGTLYRIIRALVAVHSDVEWKKNFIKIRNVYLEQKLEDQMVKAIKQGKLM